MHRLEFTVEPFVEGQPGPHVTAPADALRSMGLDVEIGPFGSACDAPADQSADAVAAVIRAAFANGADHVNVDVSDREACR